WGGIYIDRGWRHGLWVAAAPALKYRQRGPIRRSGDVPVRGVAAGRLRIPDPMDVSFLSGSDARLTFPHRAVAAIGGKERLAELSKLLSVSLQLRRHLPVINFPPATLYMCWIDKGKEPTGWAEAENWRRETR